MTREKIREGINKILSNPLLPEDDVVIEEDSLVKGRMIYFISQRRKDSLVKLIEAHLDSQGIVIPDE